MLPTLYKEGGVCSSTASQYEISVPYVRTLCTHGETQHGHGRIDDDSRDPPATDKPRMDGFLWLVGDSKRRPDEWWGAHEVRAQRVFGRIRR